MKMKCILRIIVLLLLSVYVKKSTCQEESPCPDVFQYYNDGEKIYGIINIPTPREGQWTVLNVSIGSNGQAHSGERYLELFKSRDETAKDAKKGRNIRYRLLLPVHEGDEIPVVKNIYINGINICKGLNTHHWDLFPVIQRTKSTEVWDSVCTIVFYQNNWSFKHNYFFGDRSLRTEHTSNTEEYFPSFSDWLYAQPKSARFPSDSSTMRQSPPDEPDKRKPVSMSMIELTPRMADNGLWLKDLPYKCGMRPPMEIRQLQLATLILNGTAVAKGEYPWLVYLEYTNRNTICGGTLVSDRHIITAAHCVEGQQVTGVQLGKYDRFMTEKGSIRRDIRTAVVHPDFKMDQADADIAILFIDAVPLTQQIFPACIWPFGINLDSAFPYATVAGWGIFRNDEPSSRIPMKTNVPIVSLEMCRQSAEHFKTLATDHTICAGGQFSGPCYGDSGSGFYFRHKTTWYLRGVVSTSLRDIDTNYCQTNHYAVYVDIAFYLDWLRPYITDIENEIVKITSRIDSRFRDTGKATIEISA